MYAEKKNPNVNMYKLMVVELKTGKKVIDLKKELFSPEVTFVKSHGHPYAFYEANLMKLYYIKHRAWYSVDPSVDTKKGYFTFDSLKKCFVL